MVRAHASSSFSLVGRHTKIFRRLGVSVAPLTPELKIDTSGQSVDASARQILAYLEQRGVV